MPPKHEEIKRTDAVWRVAEYAEKYYGEVRGGIPFSSEHMETMLRLIDGLKRPVRRFLDLGCGNGLASGVILLRHPEAKGVLVDFSEEMLMAARIQLAEYGSNIYYCEEDLTKKNWLNCSIGRNPYEVVVSSFMVHHLPDARKKELFKEVLGLLAPGGIFVLVEQVAPVSRWHGELGLKLFQKSLLEFHRRKGSAKTPSQAWELVQRFSKYASILAPVDRQLEWLREIGYTDVDCYFKLFEGAVFGGRKPVRKNRA